MPHLFQFCCIPGPVVSLFLHHLGGPMKTLLSLSLLLTSASALAHDGELVWDADSRWASRVGDQGNQGERSEVETETSYARGVGWSEYGYDVMAGMNVIFVGGKLCAVRPVVRNVEPTGFASIRALDWIGRCNYAAIPYVGYESTTIQERSWWDWDGGVYDPNAFTTGLMVYQDDDGAVVGTGLEYTSQYGMFHTWSEETETAIAVGDLSDLDGTDSMTCPVEVQYTPNGYREARYNQWVATGVALRYDADDTVVGMKLICHRPAILHQNRVYEVYDWWWNVGHYWPV
jgi:hypothetical protein